ncbi:hypothetical protein [Sphingomonas sp. ID0503]|uniref:hypothetical protein n=1 Tax=Sphingomonas sp. ID0503 TaxID=3399691 RepID=UPI003AFB3F9A
MATQPVTTGAPARASSNLIRLPTAARRQVHNNRYADQRRAALAAREASPWPGEYKMPWQRDEDRRKAAQPSLTHIKRTPALVIAMALYGMASEERREGALAAVKLMAMVDTTGTADDALLLMNEVANLTESAAAVVSATREGR